MGYNMYFDYAAFVLMLVLLFSVIYRKMNKTRSGKCFLLLLSVSFIDTIFDIMSVYGKLPLIVNEVSEYFYMFLRSSTALMLCLYLISLTDTEHIYKRHKFLSVLLIIPIFASVVLLIVNSFTGCVFEYTKVAGVKTLESGNLKIVYYILPMLYLLYGAIYIVKFRNMFTDEKLICALSIYPTTVGAVIGQALKPELMLEMFATAIAMLFLIISVERPEDKLDYDTDFKKYSAFVEDSRRASITRKNSVIIVTNTLNFESARTLLGYIDILILKQGIATVISETCKPLLKRAEYYSMGSGRFAIAFDNIPSIDRRLIANKLKEALNKPISVKETDIDIFTNVMVYTCPGDINDSQMSINVVENFSRNTILNDFVFDLSTYKKINDLMIENDMDVILERGFTNNSYEVYYQPIYDLKNNRFNSAEALIRLKDEKYGFISPGVFIPYAEKNGSIHKIGMFVLEEVCKFISSDEFKNLGLDYIEVNLSSVQCLKSGFFSRVMELIKKYKINPDSINLEITETADPFSEKIMNRNITKLKKEGFTFSLDDYGTGYSNLKRISLLPLNIIKIDKTFVDSMSDEKMRGALIHTINMIKSLDVKIVVEGVETKEALDLFNECNCEYIQGYYFSKPLPQGEFKKFIENNKFVN